MGETDRKNVVVVGAGASTDFGLPVGATLKQSIAQMCALKPERTFDFSLHDPILNRAVYLLASREPETYPLASFRSAADAISRSLPLAPSIDNYLDTHKDKASVIALGKMAIIRAISESERQSALRVDQSNIHNKLDLSRLVNTWLAAFCEILLSGRNFEDFCQALNAIEFITYNYDRCIEQFFYNLAKVYFYDVEDAAQIVENVLHVTHVYGSIGDTALNRFGNVEYATELNSEKLISRRESIRTFTEGVDDTAVQKSIKHAFLDAEILIFLGFGFHSLNLDILPTRPDHKLNRILVSKRGQSASDLVILKSHLSAKFGVEQSFIMTDATNAADVFREYHRFLSRPPLL